MKIAVITPTSDRPQALEILSKCMERQIQKPDQWIIVDGSEKSSKAHVNTDLDFLVFKKRKRSVTEIGPINLGRNLILGMQTLSKDIEAVLIMEDDDYYFPSYIQKCSKILEHNRVVGNCWLRYYNVAHRKWWVGKNNGPALHNTGFRLDLESKFLEACAVGTSGNYNIDRAFWKGLRDPISKDPFQLNMVSIKGVPGRFGLGSGHKPKSSWVADYNLVTLKNWIGKDVDLYRDMFNLD